MPNELAITYYTQRASAGLLITEATQISPDGQGYPDTPGIHSPEQIAGWKKITDCVHAAGGKIVLQLWYTGRISHSVFLGGKSPVSASALKPTGHVYLPGWKKADYETPRALETAEIPGIVAQYATAAANAKAAGFDGVEVHAANGYLIDQFLRDGSNHRTDQYGGSIENRCRFLVEVTEAVVAAWGDSGGVGVRFSPHNPYNDMSDSDPAALFTAAAASLKRFGLAYIHVLEPVGTTPALAGDMKAAIGGIPLIVNGSYDYETGTSAVAGGVIDAVAYGKLYIANPDLVERFAAGSSLNEPNPKTFYGGGAAGYTDYPTLNAAAAAE